MSDKSDKKVKGFRISTDLHTIVASLIKESGKEDGEWFEDILQQLQTNQLVVEKSNISKDLRYHFGSDVASMKEATTLIHQLFINQMNRIAVEKTNWSQNQQSIIEDYDKKIVQYKQSLQEIEQKLLSSESNNESTQATIIQLQNKIDGFDKLEAQFRKEIEKLEAESNQRVLELKQGKEESVLERDKHHKEMDLTRAQFKEEKDQLNQQIVDSLNKLKETEVIQKNNAQLAAEVKELKSTIRQNSKDHELALTRAYEQAELEKEKELTIFERKLREELYLQQREDTKDLYDKIEKLQLENQRLSIENNLLRTKNTEK